MFEMKNVSFTYETDDETVNNSIKGINLQLAPGECTVLSGPSGCGKTTLIRCANGLAPNFFPGTISGSILIDGKDINSLSFHDLAGLAGSVFQDPRSQFFSTDTLSELCFVCENMGLPQKELISRAEEAVESCNCIRLLDRSVLELSGGERQILAMASVRAARPKLWILDEPSANLDEKTCNILAQLIQKLKEEGACILIAEHRLSWLRPLLDTLVIMKDGRITAVYANTQLEQLDKEICLRQGLRSFKKMYPLPSATGYPAETKTPLLRVRNIHFSRNGRYILEGTSLELRKGELSVLNGDNGAGKTSCARIMSGLQRPDSGTISDTEGLLLTEKKLRQRVYYSLQDCDYQLFYDSVENELKAGQNSKIIKRNVEFFRGLIETLELTSFLQRHPASLSRGQKQLLCAACAILSQRPILIMDEPTSGLDAKSMRVLGSLYREYARKGHSILVITHDEEFCALFADRIITMDQGRIRKECLYQLHTEQHYTSPEEEIPYCAKSC